MQHLKSASLLTNMSRLTGVYTQQVRYMARPKVVRKKKPARRLETAGVPAPAKKVWPVAPPFPEHSEQPLSPEFLNIRNVGFHSTLKGKKMVVYGLTDAQRKYETTNLNEPRFLYGMGNPNRPHIIKAFPRELPGKAFTTYLRKNGYIPCSISHMSDFNKTINIFLDPIAIEPLTRAPGAYSAIHHVEIAGYSERFRCLIRNWSIDPATRKTAHIQFMLVEPTRKWEHKVSIAHVGESECIGVKHGGVLLQPSIYMHTIHDPALGARLGHCEPPTVLSIDIVDRGLTQTFRGFEMPKPIFLEMPEDRTWNRHVFLTFTKKLG